MRNRNFINNTTKIVTIPVQTAISIHKKKLNQNFSNSWKMKLLKKYTIEKKLKKRPTINSILDENEKYLHKVSCSSIFEVAISR